MGQSCVLIESILLSVSASLCLPLTFLETGNLENGRCFLWFLLPGAVDAFAKHIRKSYNNAEELDNLAVPLTKWYTEINRPLKYTEITKWYTEINRPLKEYRKGVFICFKSCCLQ